MIHYTLISNGEKENYIKDLFKELHSRFNTEIVQGYCHKIAYIINQNEFNSRDYYVAFNTEMNMIYQLEDKRQIHRLKNKAEYPLEINQFVNMIEKHHYPEGQSYKYIVNESFAMFEEANNMISAQKTIVQPSFIAQLEEYTFNLLRRHTEHLIKELSLTQYPKEVLLKETENFMKSL